MGGAGRCWIAQLRLWRHSDRWRRRSVAEQRKVEDGRIIVRRRDLAAERSARDRLEAFGLRAIETFGSAAEDGGRIPFAFLDGRGDWPGFVYDTVPQLEREGWRIEVEDSFRYRVVDGGGEWTAEIEESGGWWFSLDLGIEIDGERVPLLPVLTGLLARLRLTGAPGELDSLARNGTIFGRLEDGRHVALPLDRTKAILSTLVELYHPGSLSAEGKLEISAGEGLGLAAVEAATRLRWLGGERLQALAERLSQFSGIDKIEPPAGLQTELRPYQKDGLNWLQFLRGYELGGILADDMGLGKTVQTLAHILVEKRGGRLDRPCLVVCPTSVVPNWLAEAARLAPQLRILSLHGSDRAERFGEIGNADLVLTTYALLSRDADRLLPVAWHIAVLDESQAIKNANAKTTGLVCRLDARHRLCLTGTPVENHLGELWSQFAFLMPGLLGDTRRFARVFRTPIEKKQDAERRAVLSGRIKPFLLRRTKALVAADLPPKTEMLRPLELAGEQRDLYETVRLAMHEKVRREVAQKGLARSHIVVLDALLKLRQVCCDPRLVKLAAARRVTASAKLEHLMEMLPQLVEDGRRILLFSQFTSMLDLIKPAVIGGRDRVRRIARKHDRPHSPGRALSAGEGAALSDQPQGRRHRSQPDRRRHRHPLRSLVEPGGRGPGDRPCSPHRPGQAGFRLQARRAGYRRRADARIAAAQKGAGRRHLRSRRQCRRGTRCVRHRASLSAFGLRSSPARNYTVGKSRRRLPSRKRGAGRNANASRRRSVMFSVGRR